ncbi:hypothetical protein [Asticcacaulis solisilvae]|uniref:hypothetical protein n=1 Tax=Asticcacaulis solisilvae TaxID=1217274 RepID=UPI003FD81DC6
MKIIHSLILAAAAMGLAATAADAQMTGNNGPNGRNTMAPAGHSTTYAHAAHRARHHARRHYYRHHHWRRHHRH